jgi:hypothetical protein
MQALHSVGVTAWIGLSWETAGLGDYMVRAQKIFATASVAHHVPGRFVSS